MLNDLVPLAVGLAGIPVIDGTRRDELFPLPKRDQRYQDRTTGDIYRSDGTGWILDHPGAQSDVKDVRAYGAAGDGVTDDSAALARAIAALADGDTLDLCGRTYRYAGASSLLLDSLSAITVRGSGATIVTGAGANVRTLVVRSCDGVVIRDLTLQLDDAEQGNTTPYEGLCIQNSSNVTVWHCAILDYNHIGITVSEIPSGAATVCDNITVELNRIERCGTFGYQHFPKVLSQNAFFLHNRVVDCGLAPFNGIDPVSVKACQATRNFAARGNIISGGRTAFGVINWESATLEGNVGYNCDGYLFAINTQVHALYTAGFAKVRIHGNVGRWESTFTPTSNYGLINLAGDNASVGTIDIEDNHALGWGAPFTFRPVVAVPHVRVARNRFVDCRAPAQCDNANGAAPLTPEFEDNEYVNTDTSRDIDVRIQAAGAVIRRDRFDGYGDRALRLNGDGIFVDGATFVRSNPNPANSVSRGAIYLTGAGTYTLRNITVDDTNVRLTYVIEDNGATSIIEHNIRAWRLLQLADVMTHVATPTTNTGWTSSGGRRRFYGAVKPTSSTYYAGDFVENTAPTITGTAGSQYIVRGWRRLTTGSAHVLNTDWVEERTLTGT